VGERNAEDVGCVDAVTGWAETASPPLSVQLLIVFGVLGAMAWMVSDVGLPSNRSTTTKVANVIMLLAFGACIVSGALLS